VDSQCSLTEALALAPAGSKVLLETAGDVSPYYGNFSLQTPSTSSLPVTIAPAGGVADPTIDGDGSSAVPCPTSACDGAVLTVTSGVYAKLRSLTIQDGDNTSTGNGGGLDDAGTVSLSAVTITGTTATFGGGADVESGASLRVTKSTFSYDSSGSDGGAIGSGDDDGTGTVTVMGSSFSNDSSASRGGAIASGDHEGTGTLTVTGSNFSNDTSDYGGAIDNGGAAGTGTLTVWGSSFSNDTGSRDGGAIDSGGVNGSGMLTITRSTFTGDSSTYLGGAIDSGDAGGTGTLTVTRSTFSDDTGYDGGAIDSGDTHGTGTLTVTRSTFSDDTATADGGAIDNGDNYGYGSLAVMASTFTGDSGGIDGGAIDNGDNGEYGPTGPVSIMISTFDGNGGDVTIYSGSAASVIIAGSIVADSTGQDCAGSVTDAGFNLENDAGTTCGFSSAEHDLVGVSPQLGPLQGNGGRTETMEPALTSPVLDQIPNRTTVTIASTSAKLCMVNDQRGLRAPVWTGCAIGSVDEPNLTLPIVGPFGHAVAPSSGGAEGGTRVTIKGVNFTGVTAVTFGGVAATKFKVISSHEIIAVSPAGTADTTVIVAVTASGGTSPWRPTDQYTYI
jgi:hypothetical protein